MFRRTPFLLVLAVVAWSLVAGQTPAAAPNSGQANQGQGNQGQTADPQSQPKPDSSAKGGDQSKPGDPNVLILKAPQMPITQQTAPELRAVDLEKRQKLSDGTRLQLVQLMQSEFAHVRKYFPLGDRSLVINPQGQVTPGDAALFQQIQMHGAAAKVGDKVQITGFIIHEKTITLQINGGPKKKSKWYQHISVGVGGPGGGISPTDDPNQAQPTGAEMTLQFSKQVPEMTADELRKLLSPVFDFSVKTAPEVFAETLPPKIRDAIKNHEVLVGMNREMVIMAKDRPGQKNREKDDKGKEYEEWMYGEPPQDVIFVRFYGDEVTQVKTAKVGGSITVKTEKEVDVKDGVISLAVLQASNSPQDVKQQPDQSQQQPTKRPTLRREGEQPDTEILRAPNGQTTGQQQQPHQQDDPEWGTAGEGKKPPPQNDQQPPPVQPQTGQLPQPDPQKPPL
jgi:hypothetical protein